MQLLGVGRRASGWLNKSPDGAVQTQAEVRRASVPLPVLTIAPCPRTLSLSCDWHGQQDEDGETRRWWRADHIAAHFPTWHLCWAVAAAGCITVAAGELMLCRGTTGSKSKGSWSLWVRHEGSSGLRGQPDGHSPHACVREWQSCLQQKYRTAFRSLGHQQLLWHNLALVFL